jgi:ABC-type antimicrobial peptide transport system permease subunit
MKILESFRIATKALFANKVRSVLTMLGVIIGVSAVILLVAIGAGVQGEVTSTIQGLGSNVLFIFPGVINTGGGGGFGGGGGGKPFSLGDAQYLQQRLTGVDAVVPMAQTSATAKYQSNTIRTTLVGTTDLGSDVTSAKLGGGRYFNRSESDAGSRVIVIGYTVKTQLLPNVANPIGAVISINGQRFTVIGWYEKQGGTLSGDQDNQAAVPIAALQNVTGNNRVSIILVKVTSPSDVDLVRAQIMRFLAPRFGDQVTVFSQDQTLGVFNQLLGTLTIMLAGIAGISLLVGGIGIMNIMLVSVSERTREIGIRKAVGARTYDILSQFVIEAVMLSVTGGVIGILLGALGAAALSPVVPTQITPWAVAVAFFFSAGVGVFFGVYPAWKASQLDPIVALRYE